MTITGKLETTSGAPVHCVVTFKSKSTPTVGAGIVVGNTTTRIKTNPVDGTFSVLLFAGVYEVTYFTKPDQTRFNITVPDSNSTAPIEDVVSSALTFVMVAPNTVWNGVRAGSITFDPIANPSVQSITEVVYGGGHVTSEIYRYSITHVTQDGETAWTQANKTGTGTSGRANRVALEVSPTRVTAKRIYRNDASGSTTMYLLAEVGPSVAYYDDWESHADFAGRVGAAVSSPYNTTAGKIYSDGTTESLDFSSSGIRVKASVRFDATLAIPTGAASGYVLTSDSAGVASWQVPTGGSASSAGFTGYGTAAARNATTPSVAGALWTLSDSVPKNQISVWNGSAWET